MSLETIYNFIRIDDRIVTGGQPTEAELRSAAAEGIVTVVNLATFDPRRSLPDEAGLVRSLGMAYHNIPVVWTDPRESDFEAFESLMGRLPPGPTLIHCAANFRVTAFYPLYAQKHLGWSPAQAEELRARIWKGSDHPVWERFVARIRQRIAG